MSVALLLLYVVGSLVFLCPPPNPVGKSAMWGPRIRSTAGVVDSIVFVALGPAARSMSLLYALESLRDEGRWDGPIHVVVDEEGALDCLQSHLRQRVSIIVAPRSAPSAAETGNIQGRGARLLREEEATGRSESGGYLSGLLVGGRDDISNGVNNNRGETIANAKLAKMKLLDLLPQSIQRLVYIDCDVITQQPLGSFLTAIGDIWSEVETFEADWRAENYTVGEQSSPPSHLLSRPHDRGEMVQVSRLSSAPQSTLIIFPDAAGHTIPLCWGCDVAHSGVLALARGHSERCLQLWQDAFAGGEEGNKGTATDQEALDIAIREGSGCKAAWIDRRHLRFMKDPFVMAGLTRTGTFAHFTGLLHPERLARIYRRKYEWFLGRKFEEWGAGVIEACSVG